MTITISAVNKKTGMTLDELEANIVRARAMGMSHLVKTTLGFRGQIQTLEVGDESKDVPDVSGALTEA